MLLSKIRLIQSLDLSNFLYACETWTLTAELERNIVMSELVKVVPIRILPTSHQRVERIKLVSNPVRDGRKF